MTRITIPRAAKLAGATLLILSLGGCPTFYNMGTAKTLAEGEMEFNATLVYNAISVEASGLSDDSNDAGAPDPAGDPKSSNATDDTATATIAIPYIDFGYRYGIAENMDLGFGIKGFGRTSVDFKIGLVDTGMVGIAIDPEIGGLFLGVGDAAIGYLQFDLPILIDIRPNDSLTITATLKYTGLMPFAGDEVALGHFIGGTIGVDIKIGDAFALHPFGGITYVLDTPDNVEATLPHGGLGIRMLL